MLSVRRVAPGVYDYYTLSEVSLPSLAAAVVPDAAHLKGAVGFGFRFLAGIPGDQEPPALSQSSRTSKGFSAWYGGCSGSSGRLLLSGIQRVRG